jgi:hypothetical protein
MLFWTITRTIRVERTELAAHHLVMALATVLELMFIAAHEQCILDEIKLCLVDGSHYSSSFRG